MAEEFTVAVRIENDTLLMTVPPGKLGDDFCRLLDEQAWIIEEG